MGTSIVTLASCAAVLTWPVAQEPSARERALGEFQARLVEDVLADDVGSIATGVSVGVELIFAEGIGLRDRDGAGNIEGLLTALVAAEKKP